MPSERQLILPVHVKLPKELICVTVTNFRRLFIVPASMKIMSVFGPVPQVVKRLQLFLAENRFRNVRTDYAANVITAERSVFFIVQDTIHLTVKHSKENITIIELQVNQGRAHSRHKNEIKEAAFQSRIYLYF
jgi:hypothetical protein